MYTHVYDVTPLHQALDVSQNIRHAALVSVTLCGLPTGWRDGGKTPGLHAPCSLRSETSETAPVSHV